MTPTIEELRKTAHEQVSHPEKERRTELVLETKQEFSKFLERFLIKVGNAKSTQEIEDILKLDANSNSSEIHDSFLGRRGILDIKHTQNFFYAAILDRGYIYGYVPSVEVHSEDLDSLFEEEMRNRQGEMEDFVLISHSIKKSYGLNILPNENVVTIGVLKSTDIEDFDTQCAVNRGWDRLNKLEHKEEIDFGEDK